MEHPYNIRIRNLAEIDGKKIPVGGVIDKDGDGLLTFNFAHIAQHYSSMVDTVPAEKKEQFEEQYEQAKQNLIVMKNVSKDNITKTVTLNDKETTIVLQFAEITKIPANTENIIDKIKLLANDFIANPENYPIIDGGAYTGIPLEMIDDNEE